MSNLETDFIEKVISVMKSNELTELTLEDDRGSLFIKSNGNKQAVNIKQLQIKQNKETELKEEKKLIPVVSTMIGLYFAKPSPDEKPFVQVGDKVKAGQTLCIIETIKLMNKVVAEVSGTVKEICIQDGKPVEYGQTIMYIEQD